eukprot:14935349-Ditylum_brightwellii.AAC.1
MHKPLTKKIAHVKKEHNNSGKGKHHDKLKLSHERRHGLGKHHVRKHKKKFCNYHGLYYHDMDKCNFTQTHRKYGQPTHHIMEHQRLWQVQFIKDAERHAKNVA